MFKKKKKIKIKCKTFKLHLITPTVKDMSVAYCFKKTNHSSKMMWADASEASNGRKKCEKTEKTFKSAWIFI